MTKGKAEEAAGCLGCLGILLVAFFVGAALILPHTSADGADLARMQKYRSDIVARFSVRFDSPNVRVEQLGGFNVEVWIPRHEFDSINYLDRKAFLEQTGAQWCDKVDGWSSPTVTVRDAGTGKNLAVFHCVFRYSDLNPD
jgi:hypothetical protein